tara:strand:+ start:511 stop:786 length:276 start_codon:yes stop_codon:yes gene_type:complete
MGCILCCFPKKYNEIDTNINTRTNVKTNIRKNRNYNKNNYTPYLLTDIQLQSFDDVLLENKKSKKSKTEIYRKWRENYLNNSGKLYIGCNN